MDNTLIAQDKLFNEFPIQLKYEGENICTGTILNPTVVLFALGCVLSKQLSSFRVHLKNNEQKNNNRKILQARETVKEFWYENSASKRISRNISEILTLYDDCDDVTNENDIVALVLSSALDFDDIGSQHNRIQGIHPNLFVEEERDDCVDSRESSKIKIDSKPKQRKRRIVTRLLAAENKLAVLTKNKEGEGGGGGTTIMKMATELNVVTLNCWGIAGVSRDRIPRMKAIAEELASGKYDFVFLQEVWTTEDYERIKLRTREALPYSHYFFSGVIGAGICIFSRSPIKSAFFYQWALNGYIHKIQHGDWFGGKGVGLVEVQHRGLTVNLYTTHLHAEYDRVNDEYLAHRVIQAYQTAQLISLTSRHADIVIFGGDLNTEPGDLAYRVIVHTARLRDSFFEVDKSQGFEGNTNTFTIDTPKNSYTSSGQLKSNPYGKRIDYIVYRSGNHVDVQTVSYAIPWPSRVNGQAFSYSDHEAVVVKLRVEKSSPTTANVQSFTTANTLGSSSTFLEGPAKEALEEGIEICSQALKHLKFSKSFYMISTILLFVLFLFCSAFDLTGFMYYAMPVARVVLILLMAFCIFMSVIWNRMEVHGILAGKLAMELELGHYQGGFRPIDQQDHQHAMPEAGDFSRLDYDEKLSNHLNTVHSYIRNN